MISCYASVLHQKQATLVSFNQLADKSFFTQTLAWDDMLWHLDGLDPENGKYPTLR